MIVGAAGLMTNGTWFAGGGYLGFWKDDNLRYTGYGQITMDYYGLGQENPIQFDQNVFMFLQQMNFRIGESDIFLGGKYQLSQIKVPQKNLEELGVKIGADIARGPEDYAFYISIGSAW